MKISIPIAEELIAYLALGVLGVDFNTPPNLAPLLLYFDQ